MNQSYYMKRVAQCTGLWLLLLALGDVQANEVAYRLGDNVKPSFQQINLKIDPNQPNFSGETTIDIEVLTATNSLSYYQLDLDVSQVELIDGNQRIPLSITPGEYDMQHAKAEEIIQPKHYKLHMIFSGKVNTTSDGMYLSTFEQRNYVFTQFEDMHARRAFPSFDEPNFKIPFQLTIQSPEINTVVSNTPVAKRTVDAGWQTVQFKRTKPMPTYLVAFAVGELDSAEITGLSVPGRIYTPKGQAGRTKFAIKHTPKILAALEGYFGTPYPYAKLDFIAVPNFTHGAMENAGLVTYRSSLLLLDDEPRLTEQRGPLSTIAHELAHMWYGNLVTMAWWEDLWLNEAFASWMEGKITLQLYPELNSQTSLVQEGAFVADASPTTKPIKKLVRTQTDVMDGLGLNYSKGESILQMIESLVGESAFQKAVQRYMRKHAWGNTQADDLWEVFSSVTDFDVPGMMKTYLEQPAYPLVSFSPNGEVSQARYHLAGAEVKQQQWIVPLAITYKKNDQILRTNLFLKDPTTLVSKLAEAQWIYPNDNAMGYMRWKIPANQMSALLQDLAALNVREKKSLLYNSDALLKANEITLEQHMAVLDSLAEDHDPAIARAVVASLNDLVYLVDNSNKKLFATFIQAKLQPWFADLGVNESPADSDDVSRLRTAIFGILGRYGDDAQVLTASQKLVKQYLVNPTSMSRAMAGTAMRNLAVNGDASWFECYKQAYINTTDANIQGAIGYGMLFPQPANVRKLLDLTLTPQVSPANVLNMLSVASSARDDLDIFYAWLSENMQKITAKMPAYHIARMPEYVSSTCSAHNIQLTEAFYAQRMHSFEGMTRSYEVAMDESNQCMALKKQNQGVFSNYLTAFANQQ